MVYTGDSANANNFSAQGQPSALLTLSALRIGRPERLMNAVAPSTPNIIKLLNDSLATELVCVLRYKRNHFMAVAMGMPEMAEAFLLHSSEEMTHAEKLAQRIVELGGAPDFSPVALNHNGHASYDDFHDLVSMTRSHLVAEHAAIETYAQIVDVLAGTDPVTQKLVEGIVLEELDHAHSLNDWFGQVNAGQTTGQRMGGFLSRSIPGTSDGESNRP